MLRYDTAIDGFVVPLDMKGLKILARAPAAQDPQSNPGPRHGQRLHSFDLY